MKNYLFIFIVITFMISCVDSQDEGPEEIYYGEDICERCKMIISDRKFAAQYTAESGKTKKFDDLGCMIEFIIDHNIKTEKIRKIYVVDHNTSRWINAQDAYYIYDKDIKTPMGYNIIAFSDKGSAQKFTGDRETTHIGGFSDLKTYLSDALENSD
jgi:copper chaperone NosL